MNELIHETLSMMSGTPYCKAKKIFLYDGSIYFCGKNKELYLSRERDEQGIYHYYMIHLDGCYELARFNFHNIAGVEWLSQGESVNNDQ